MINFAGSPTSSNSQLEYPHVPPQDYQVKNDLNNATLVRILIKQDLE